MKNFIIPFIAVFFFSCKTLQVSESKTSKNLTSLGIEWDYSEKVNEQYKPLVDAAIASVISDFNAEKHVFTVHKKAPRDKDYITIDFGKGKIVSKGEQIAGYAVSTIGLIAVPAALIASESPILLAFYYLPQNKLESRISLSPVLTAEKYRDKKLLMQKGTLFSNRKKQAEKLVTKFSAQLKKVLVNIENQVKAR
ncbi:MAG TPA: hypothetical protein VF622_10480 [Segetibacter sp.]|jgi:hypothetical protein